LELDLTQKQNQIQNISTTEDKTDKEQQRHQSPCQRLFTTEVTEGHRGIQNIFKRVEI